jgi:hypothetical protein
MRTLVFTHQGMGWATEIAGIKVSSDSLGLRRPSEAPLSQLSKRNLTDGANGWWAAFLIHDYSSPE